MQNQGIMNYMCSHQSKFRDEQENELFSQLNKAKLAENNDDCHRIRNILVEKNLGLVRKIIRQDYYQNHDSGMTEDDLMQEGAIGLMKAISGLILLVAGLALMLGFGSGNPSVVL